MNPSPTLEYRLWAPRDDKAEAGRQRNLLRQRYPDGSEDTSVEQIEPYLSGIVGADQIFCCFDAGQLVGLLAYQEYLCETPMFVFLQNFGVLPSHQRKGIGTELMRRAQERASSRRLPVIVRAVRDEALPLLSKTGFWEVPGFIRNRRFKWSDVPEHRNNVTPWPDDDD